MKGWVLDNKQLRNYGGQMSFRLRSQPKNKPVRVITHNVFQIPWFVALYYKVFYNDVPIDNCTDQYLRAQRLCTLLNQYDICALQEMWGSSLNFIHETLASKSFHTPELLSSFIQDGKMQDWKNTWAAFNQRTGGLYTAVRKDMPIIWYKHHNFTYDHGEEGVYKSVGFCLLDMSAYWPEKFLLVVNVHFHSPGPYDDTIARTQQRSEVVEQFRALHNEQLYPLNFRWENCGVVFMGGFSVAYSVNMRHVTIEYKKLHEEFSDKTHDVYVEVCNQESADPNLKERSPELFDQWGNYEKSPHQYTYDTDTNVYANRRTLNDTSRMDYIFTLDTIPAPGPLGKTRTMPLRAESCNILVQEAVDQTSDHYPVVACLTPVEDVINY